MTLNPSDDSTRAASPKALDEGRTILPECEAIQECLIALLYEDGEPVERTRARDHLAKCVPCRLEYSDLKGVRTELAGWTLASPGLAPVAAASPGISPPRVSSSWMPAALAAAAGLVLGLGLAVAGRDTFAPPSTPPQAVAQNLPSAPSGPAEGAGPRYVSYSEVEQLLQSQESRHQAELSQLRQTLDEVSASVTPVQNPSTGSSLSSAAVERLVRQSEARQAQLIEARLQSLKTEADLQRQYDMAQIAAGLAYIDSRTGADAARTSELMKNLVRVTAKPQDR